MMVDQKNDASPGKHLENGTPGHIAGHATRYSADTSTATPNMAGDLLRRDAAHSHLLYHSHTIAEVETMACERMARSRHQPTVKKVERSVPSKSAPDMLSNSQSTKRVLSQNPSDVSDSEATRSSPRSCLSHLRIDSQSNSQNDHGPITAPSSAPPSPDEEKTATSDPTVVVPPTASIAPMEDVHSTLTPSSTVVSSERASSPLTFENFAERTGNMKKDYYEQGKIFTKTRHMMCAITNKLYVVGSRGYARAGWVPTKQTTPRLHSRRYSIDVNTKNWDRQYLDGWDRNDMIERMPRPIDSCQAEPPIRHAPWTYLPNPCRYSGFGSRIFWTPPRNDERYLDLGEATIKNRAFLDIAATSFYNDQDPWMHADCIDMALEILRQKTNCERYSIDIANSNSAQIFYIAAQCNDGSTREFEQYRARFCDKRWIFVVVNDGFGGDRYDATIGTHWSLVAVNRQAKTAHYYDSYWIKDRYHQHVGREVARGLLLILGEDVTDWEYEIDYNSPDQDRDNLFQKDVGACGPFIYEMTRELIKHIKLQQDNHAEAGCGLCLPYGYNNYFQRIFNSRLVRHQIQQDMVLEKCRLDTPVLIDRHDRIAVQGEDVALSHEPPLEFIVPRQQRAVRLSRYSRITCTPSPDWNSASGSEADDTTRHDSDSGTEAAEDIVLDSPESEAIVDTEANSEQGEDHEGGIDLISSEDCGDAEEDKNTTMSADQPRIVNTDVALDIDETS